MSQCAFQTRFFAFLEILYGKNVVTKGWRNCCIMPNQVPGLW